MSRPALLLDEGPLQVLPSLVRLLGDHVSAMALQQIHYRSRLTQPVDGVQWAVQTNEQWCADLVMSPGQLRRVFASLTKAGLIVTEQPGQYDRVAWRRVDFDRLDRMITDSVENDAIEGSDSDLSKDQILIDVPISRSRKKIEENALPVQPSLAIVGGKQVAAVETVNQRAKRITDGYWAWYQSRHGTDPLVGFNAYRGIIAKALKAGHTDLAVKQALVAMHDSRTPLSAEALDRQLTRPTGGVLAQLGELRFDAEGNLLPDNKVIDL